MSSSRRAAALVVILLFVAIGISACGFVALGLLFSTSVPPSIASNSTLYLKVDAPFREVELSDVFSAFMGRRSTLRTTIETITKAKNDPHIKTLVVMPQAGGALWGQIQEVRAAITDFRSSGKPVTAFLEYGGAQEYFLASAANRVLMMPAGSLDLSGLATYELFFRGALDKIGVYPDLLHIGDYKTFSNTFTEKTFTPAHKEMTRSLNHDWYEQLVSAIAEGRKKSAADIKKAIDGGPYLAENARKAGLVDALAYEDQIDDDEPVRGTNQVEGETYERAEVPMGPSETGRIALLYAVGDIASGASSFDGPGGLVLGSETFVKWIRKVRIDSSVRAIVVRIDSPGGSAIASDVIWRELMLARAVKPLIVSMGDVAASGGYYIAAPAHVIVAEPGTITGSIGVVTGKFVLKGTFDKLGIGAEAVSEGQFAEIDSPIKPFSKEERARIEEQMHATYDLFLSRVAEGRRSTPAKIDTIAQGRVWTGHQARELGLVDELGSLDTAIQIAKQRAKIDPSKRVPLLIYPQRRTFFEVLADPFGSAVQGSLEVLYRRPEARLLQSLGSSLRLFRRGEPLTIMPNVFFSR